MTNEYSGKYYSVRGWSGIAWYVVGLETKPDSDTEWTGIENETGNLIMVMVGDDRKRVVDPDDITELTNDAFCRECGQIGCGCNVCASL